MADADLVAAVVLGAIGGGAGRVLSAPLDAVADQLKERVKSRLERTIEKAEAKAEGRPLEHNDRISSKVLNEAAFNDDELMAEYLGGVLAASGPDDDSGAAIVAQISRLSAVQLRLHYIIYREARRLIREDPPNLYVTDEGAPATIRIPVVDVYPAGGGAASHPVSILPVLAREGLVHERWQIGVEGRDPHQPLAYTIRVRPTGIGAELFLWGHGVRPPTGDRLFDSTLDFVMLTEVEGTPCVTLASEAVLSPLDHEPLHEHTALTSTERSEAAGTPEPLTRGQVIGLVEGGSGPF